MRSEQTKKMACGRTNFQPFKVFLSLLLSKITFLDFKKERTYSFNFQVTSKGIIMVYKVVKLMDEEWMESLL